jgi:Ca2+-binding EF-hand superfamily protein
MPAAALIVPLLLVAADAPINVVGHAWAPFISPMGEPFRARTASDDTLANWFYQADRNRDGALTPDEMQADAERFFATLDEDRNGEIEPEEIAHYEYEIAPDVQVMSRIKRAPGDPPPAARQEALDGEPVSRRGRELRRSEQVAQLGIGGSLQGAARYALLNIPEPVAAADTDFNRGISLAEFRHAATVRFTLLDGQQAGRLTLDQLQAVRAANWATAKRRRGKRSDPDARVGNGLPREWLTDRE